MYAYATIPLAVDRFLRAVQAAREAPPGVTMRRPRKGGRETIASPLGGDAEEPRDCTSPLDHDGRSEHGYWSMGNHTVPLPAALLPSTYPEIPAATVITRSFFVSAAFNLSRSPDFLSPPANRLVTPFSVNTPPHPFLPPSLSL